MILLQANKIARRFGAETLFEAIDLTIADQARLSLVGRNGAGKSNLLKILAGLEPPSEGRVSSVKGLTIGYLAQDAGLTSELTIFDELLTVFDALRQMEGELRQMESQMADLSGIALSDLMKVYDARAEAFRRDGGFNYETEVKSVLFGFSFPETVWQQRVSELSGGQKTRLALAKLLLEKPALLIMDEPTNHLDIATLSWLEAYLKGYSGSLLIVSHDRYFLDRVTTETLELERGVLSRYTGNYSRYVEQKEQERETQLKAFGKQQKEIAKLEDFVDRNLARASTTRRAQSRRKQLEKMERLEPPASEQASAQITFRPEKKSGNAVLSVTDAAIGYERILSEPINIDLRKGEALAIVGPNGIGKTTLIRALVEQIPFLKGGAKLGANVTLGYYDQEQSRLTATNTALEELWAEHRLLPELEIRNLLAAFLFTGEEVKKTVAMLSGGEKARLLLAKLALERDNFLLLDEPTNHLDIDSREALEAGLIDFEGTLLFVSHDRYFINRVATQVLELSSQGSRLYLGDYDYYLEKKAEEERQAVIEEPKAESKIDIRMDQKKEQREERRLRRELEGLEQKLADLDEQVGALEAQMLADAADFQKLAELQVLLLPLQEEKTQLEENWLALSEELEGE